MGKTKLELLFFFYWTLLFYFFFALALVPAGTEILASLHLTDDLPLKFISSGVFFPMNFGHFEALNSLISENSALIFFVLNNFE